MKKEVRSKKISPIFILALLAISVGCGAQQPVEGDAEAGKPEKLLNVVATTTIVGDVVGAIGGELIDLEVLLPPGADPHVYEVTPRDVATLANADLIFINGLGLESFLEPVLESVLEDSKVISVSEGIVVRRSPVNGGDGENIGEIDPHVWFDPLRVLIWVDNIEDALTSANAEKRDVIHENAEAYRQQLRELDEWIVDRIDQLPGERRLIVTDHDSFGYLVERYDLELVGTVIPGYSTQAEPSAKGLAELLEEIKRHEVTAVFVSDSVNSSLAEQIARDSGIRLIPLSTGSLTEASGEAATYLDFMRVNIKKITDALSAGN